MSDRRKDITSEAFIYGTRRVKFTRRQLTICLTPKFERRKPMTRMSIQVIGNGVKITDDRGGMMLINQAEAIELKAIFAKMSFLKDDRISAGDRRKSQPYIGKGRRNESTYIQDSVGRRHKPGGRRLLSSDRRQTQGCVVHLRENRKS